MFETTHALSHVLTLLVSTFLFAGMWSNDQPVQTLTGKAPLIREMAVQEIAPVEPEWVPVTEAQSFFNTTESPEDLAGRELRNAAQNVQVQVYVGQEAKTFTAESENLLISEQILAAHLSQLPLGLAPGDYRIVDSLGGVGWLRVRGDDQMNSLTSAPRLISTTVDDANTQFIRVESSSAKVDPAATLR